MELSGKPRRYPESKKQVVELFTIARNVIATDQRERGDPIFYITLV